MEKTDVVTTTSLGLLGPCWSLASCTGSYISAVLWRTARTHRCACHSWRTTQRMGCFSPHVGIHRPRYARFSSFPLSSPRQVIHSLQRVFTKHTEQTPGHTAVGGLAVYLMLILIGLTALSGMASSDDILFAGPLEPFLSPAFVDLASQAHPILSKLVLITIIAHVSAVFWHQFVMKEPLIQGMFHGLKPGFGYSIGHPHPFSKIVLLRGFILFSLCIGGAYGILGIYLGW